MIPFQVLHIDTPDEAYYGVEGNYELPGPDELGICVHAQLGMSGVSDYLYVELRPNADGQLDIWGEDEGDGVDLWHGGLGGLIERHGRYPVIQAVREAVRAAWEAQL